MVWQGLGFVAETGDACYNISPPSARFCILCLLPFALFISFFHFRFPAVLTPVPSSSCRFLIRAGRCVFLFSTQALLLWHFCSFCVRCIVCHSTIDFCFVHIFLSDPCCCVFVSGTLVFCTVCMTSIELGLGCYLSLSHRSL